MAWTALTVGCEVAPEAEGLLQVTPPAAALEVVDGRLVLEGDGFPLGRRGTLHLEGRTHRPGEEPAPCQIRVPTTVASPERAVADLGTTGLAAGSSFTGRATLRFPGRNGVPVTAAPVSLAFFQPGALEPAQRLALEARVTEAFRLRGVALRTTPDGVVVARSSMPDLREGDLVVRAAGFPVERLVHLARTKEGAVLDPLEVLGPGRSAAAGLRRVSLVASPILALPAPSTRLGSGMPFALCSSWAAAIWLSRRRGREATRPGASEGAVGRQPSVLARAFQALALAAPLAAAVTGFGGLLDLWAGLLITRTLASPRLRGTPAHVLVAVLRSALAVLPVGLLLVAVGAVSGTQGLAEVVAWQADQRLPALVLAVPPFLFGSFAWLRAGDVPGVGIAPSVHRALVAGAATVVFLGGPGLGPPAVGAGLSAGIAVAVLLAGERIAARRPGWSSGESLAWLSAGAGASLGILWASAPSPEVVTGTGVALAVLLLGPLGAAVLRRVGV
jgi:hypothetical protein